MKNKIYLITYTSRDKYELSKGVMIVEAQKRQNAMLLFKKHTTNREITDIKILRKTKSVVIFNQDVSIL